MTVGINTNNSPSPQDLAELFIATMMWGYGKTGHGASRVKVMISSPPFTGVIAKVTEAAKEAQYSYAYSLMHNGFKARIPKLGVAFATKYLHFVSIPALGKLKPLILDSQVAGSIKALCEKARLPDSFQRRITHATAQQSNPQWSDSGYMDYLNLMHYLANQLEVKPDQLEMFLWNPPPNFP